MVLLKQCSREGRAREKERERQREKEGEEDGNQRVKGTHSELWSWIPEVHGHWRENKPFARIPRLSQAIVPKQKLNQSAPLL